LIEVDRRWQLFNWHRRQEVLANMIPQQQ